jgi:tetratricopeptide (TPR) repeat protein
MHFGAYRLLETLGEGGMGTVYKAEQATPRRLVALKVIRSGAISPAQLLRFERETEALGRLTHPGIAQIHEAGTAETPNGRQPYFAMEYVNAGEPLTVYAARAQLTVRQRLELIARICDAVQHAHQRGVIHRDLKPGNILIDPTGQPKILDFGIAKVTDADIPAPLQTMVGEIVGTLAYMSPEQIGGDPLDIDTRTDVYALGVILYELLEGRLPYEVNFGHLAEAARIICEAKPAPLRSLNRVLDRDIQWIVMKALEKEKSDRYQSASELAADLRRALEHQPVLAGRPSTGYRVRKFVRRHRVGVGAAALVLVALVTGTTLATVGLVRALQAEEAARQDATTANRVTEFLVELFQISDPSQARGNTVTAREILDRGSERIQAELDDEPFVRTRLLFEMGRVYLALGLYPAAEEMMRLALDSEANAADDRLRRFAILEQLSVLSGVQGRRDEALAYATQAVADARAAVEGDHPGLARASRQLGQIHMDRGELDAADALFGDALRIFELSPDAASPSGQMEIAWTLLRIGWLRQWQGAYDDAVPVYERALSIARRQFADDDPVLAYYLNDAAVLQGRLGNFASAEDLHRQALEVREKTLEAGDPAIAESLDSIGTTFWFRQDYEQAKVYWERALATRRARLEADHPLVGSSLNNVALAARALGNLTEARALYEEALSISEARNGASHRDTALVLGNLGGLLTRLGDYAAAQEALERSLRIREASLGPEHTEVAEALLQLSYMHIRRGDRAGARRHQERALAIFEAALGADHPDTADALHVLGLLRESVDDLHRAVRIYEDAQRPRLADALWDLAWLYERAGDVQSAQEALERARAVMSAQEDNAGQGIFELARANGLSGFHDQALFKLRQASELGFAHESLNGDEAFARLRGNAAFESVAAEMAARTN